MKKASVLNISYNVWCYEQVCLVEMFKLPKMLLANLIIARVSGLWLFNDKQGSRKLNRVGNKLNLIKKWKIHFMTDF